MSPRNKKQLPERQKVTNLIEKIIEEKDISNSHLVVEAYKPLLISSIKKYYNKSYQFEELMQEGILEIIESIKDFDNSRNIPFSGYLKRRIYYFYLGKNHIKENLSLDINIGEEKEITLGDLIEDNMNIEEDYLKKENSIEIKKALEKLTKRQREIIEDFYFHKKSIGEIAIEKNIKYRTVVNTKTTALEKLKKIIVKTP